MSHEVTGLRTWIAVWFQSASNDLLRRLGGLHPPCRPGQRGSPFYRAPTVEVPAPSQRKT
jgi:hypothetical protein